MRPGVPTNLYKSANTLCVLIYSLLRVRSPSGSATGTSIPPKATIAFSFLYPMTAPSHDRAASRPLLQTIPEIRDSFSLASPIQLISASLPHSSRRMSSVWKVSKPQRWLASLISAWPFLSTKKTGFSEIPLRKIASNPECFILGPNQPPLFTCPQVLVKGDFLATVYREPI
jgi:hypothetical protein